MIEPLRLSFDVQAPADHAFSVWTERIDRWWPADHTHSGLGDLDIVLEGHVGGRIFERTDDGQEWDWGRIQIWEPPQRFVYSWHLKRTPEEATGSRFASCRCRTRRRESRSSIADGSASGPKGDRGAIEIVAAGRPCCRTTWGPSRRPEGGSHGNGKRHA